MHTSLTMSTRSKQGCWTCRLRRKKCDEGQPYCNICRSLSITCYGYGERPGWMDGGDQERSMAENFKQIVKTTSRKKRPIVHVRNSTPRQPLLKPARPKSSPMRYSPDSEHSTSAGVPSSYPVNSTNQIKDDSPSENCGCASSGHTFAMLPAESILLMHFLDNVFPLQYPAYQPEVVHGGRGWLLQLLLQTKPLYHAALALSAYHRLMVTFEILPNQCRLAAAVQQEQQLERCLVEVQQAVRGVNHFIGQNMASNRIGLISSIIQLVFFELFTGASGVWKIHLNAAIDMTERECSDKLAHTDLTKRSKSILYNDLPLQLREDSPLVTQEVVTFRFMGGTSVWLDLVASVTTGRAPRLIPYHPRILGANSQTRFASIMGCENWVLFQIGRIAKLHSQLAEARKLGQPDTTGSDQLPTDIEEVLQRGLARLSLDNVSMCDRDCSVGVKQVHSITMAFARMGLVYLHLVIHGFRLLDSLHATISATTAMIQTCSSSGHLSAMICPLFVVGCVARPGKEQQLFSNIFSTTPVLEPLLKHRGKLLPVLEVIWNSRKESEGYLAWHDVLTLTNDLLL
ncbi:fungal-specific transcription factor domain-containing protein, partial [Xylariales sp. PMI_506]